MQHDTTIKVRRSEAFVHIAKENHSVLVVGDSMLKNLTQQKISKSTNTRVRVKSYSGATVRDMKDHIKPGLRSNPDNVILHIGTNDIHNKEVPEIANQVADLCEQIKKSNHKSKITISEIITRDDNHSFKSKINEANKLLHAHFIKSEISILSHANLDRTRRLQRRSLRLPTRSKSAQTRHFCRSKLTGLKVGRGT